MTSAHKHYEMLTALAAMGQLTGSELRDLKQHAMVCMSCRERMAEMEEMSRELFLAHAQSAGRSPLPAGMQQRFLERARSAGIPLSRPVSGILNSSFLCFAFVTLLLMICATLSWKLLLPRVSERESASADKFSQGVVILQQDHELSNISNEHWILIPSHKRQEVKRKTISQREPVTVRSAESATKISQTTFTLSQPSVLKHDYARAFSDNTSMVSATLEKNYMTSGLHLPGRVTFELVSMPNIWGAVDHERSDQRTFHYNPNLASLSFLDGPQGSGQPTPPAHHVSPIQFHLDVNKTW